MENNGGEESCPQIFIDLMHFTLRSIHTGSTDPEYFMNLCDQYNKERRDFRKKITTLEKCVTTLVRKSDGLENRNHELGCENFFLLFSTLCLFFCLLFIMG